MTRALQALLCLLLGMVIQATAADIALQTQVIATDRGEQALLATPVAASTFDETRLAQAAIERLPELGVRTPGLAFSADGSVLSLRGIGSATPAAPATVALFVDDVYLRDWRYLDAARLFDTQRIEVLRGPRGAALGPGAMGGALRLYSQPPPMTWQSKVVADLGSDALRSMQGLIRGPITDQFAMSVAGARVRRDAWDTRPADTAGAAARDDDYLRAAFTYHWHPRLYTRVQALDIDQGDADLRSASLLSELALDPLRLKYLGSWVSEDRPGEARTRRTAHDLTLYSAPGTPLTFSGGVSLRQETLHPIGEAPDGDSDTLGSWLRAGLSPLPRLRLDAGLRYSRLRSRGYQRSTEDFWDGELTANVQLARAQHLYLRMASGHSGAGLAANAALSPEQGARLLSAELGYKGRLLDDRLQMQLAIYRQRPEDLPGSPHSSLGLEGEISWLVAGHWRLGASWAWADDRRPPPQAGQQIAVFTQANWRWAWAQMTARLDYLRARGGCGGLPGCDADERSASQWDANLQASYREWSLTLYADNLADADFGREPASSGDALNAPRQLGLRVRYQLR